MVHVTVAPRHSRRYVVYVTSYEMPSRRHMSLASRDVIRDAFRDALRDIACKALRNGIRDTVCEALCDALWIIL